MNQLKMLMDQHDVIEIQQFVRNNSVEIEEIKELLVYALQQETDFAVINYYIKLLNHNLNYCSKENGLVPLFLALQHKKYNIAERLLEHKADINYIDNNEENVLLYLYQKKYLDEPLLLFLLDKGIDVSYCQRKTDKTFLDYIDEYRNRNFINIILKYFYNNDVEVVLKLILSSKNQWGLTDRNLKEIIRYNINPKIKNKLMLLAYHHNNIDLLKFLFKSSEDNIDFIKKYEQQEKFIDYKIYSNELEILLIENGAEIDSIVPNYYDNQYTELLRICKFTNILERVKFLVSYGAKINQRSIYRNEFSDPGTPMIFAIKRESPDIAKYLYESGADCLKVKDAAHNTALTCALDHFRYLKYITEGTSYLNPHYLLKTMIEACARNNIEGVKYFVEHGVDINQRLHCKYGHGVTALWVACQHHHLEIVQYLVEAGAYLDYVYVYEEKEVKANGHGKIKGTVLNLALQTQDKDIVHYLTKRNAGIYDAEGCHRILRNDIGLVYRYGGLPMASHILKNRRLRSEVDKEGNTILMKILASFPDEEAYTAITYFLNKPKIRNSLNAQNVHGETLLMQACRRNAKALVKILIKQGAKVNIVNNQGQTALHIACQEELVEIVKILLEEKEEKEKQEVEKENEKEENKVKEEEMEEKEKEEQEVKEELERINVNRVSKREGGKGGETALIIACRQNHSKIAKMLIEHGADWRWRDAQQWTALTYAYRNGNELLIQYINEKEKEKVKIKKGVYDKKNTNIMTLDY